MKPPETQSKSYTDRFNELVNEMMFNSVTKDEIKGVVDTFIQKYKELSEKLTSKVAENQTSMSIETARIGKQVSEFEGRIRGIIDGKTDTLSKEIDAKLNELFAIIGYVEQRVTDEAYDDSQMMAKMEVMHKELLDSIPKMPKEFDASEIMGSIEKLEKEIDALKKRQVGTVSGGVTNLRVAQAFKTILKTEEPVGDIDGVNLTYSVSQPIFAILSMSINGETIAQLPNYTINGNTFTFTSALPAAYLGKDFEVKYV